MAIATFLELLTKAADAVEPAYPGSAFYEADGSTSDNVASKETDVDTWHFVFRGPAVKGGPTSVVLDCNKGALGKPALGPGVMGDAAIVFPHWPIKMGLQEAIDLKATKGYGGPFGKVTLRWPVYPGCKEPVFIFNQVAGDAVIFVGTESRSVTPVHRAAMDGASRVEHRAGQKKVSGTINCVAPAIRTGIVAMVKATGGGRGWSISFRRS